MHCGVSGRVFAQRRGSNESDAAVDSQTDDDRQVRNGATDGDRNRLDHVSIVLQRRRVTGQQLLPHISAYKTRKYRGATKAGGDGREALVNDAFTAVF